MLRSWTRWWAIVMNQSKRSCNGDYRQHNAEQNARLQTISAHFSLSTGAYAEKDSVIKCRQWSFLAKWRGLHLILTFKALQFSLWNRDYLMSWRKDFRHDSESGRCCKAAIFWRSKVDEAKSTVTEPKTSKTSQSTNTPSGFQRASAALVWWREG